MNKEKDKWVKNWKERLGDYREPAPADLWTELEKELNAPRTIPFYRRYAAVAAVVSTIVLSGVAVWWLKGSSPEYVEQMAGEIAAVVPVPDFESVSAKPSVITPDRMPQSAAFQFAKAEPVAATMLAAVSQTHGDDLATKAVETPEKVRPQSKAVPSNRMRAARKGQYTYDFSSPDSHVNTSKGSFQNKWSVGLSVGNAPIGASTNAFGYRNLSKERSLMQSLPNELMAANAYTQLLSHNLDNTVHSKTKHKMPVTVGVSVRWQLNNHWALESGLTYTKLVSELWSGTENDYYESDQKLHYVGIPLKASYKVWENKYFSFYVSAGGAVEKCVSGKLNTNYIVNGLPQGHEQESLNVKDLQWSISSAVGAQVKLTPHIGFYVEPGVNYYFKDGSAVETVRKEHPLNFNLQTGLRLSY